MVPFSFSLFFQSWKEEKKEKAKAQILKETAHPPRPPVLGLLANQGWKSQDLSASKDNDEISDLTWKTKKVLNQFSHKKYKEDLGV